METLRVRIGVALAIGAMTSCDKTDEASGNAEHLDEPVQARQEAPGTESRTSSMQIRKSISQLQELLPLPDPGAVSLPPSPQFMEELAGYVRTIQDDPEAVVESIRAITDEGEGASPDFVKWFLMVLAS